MLDNGQTLRYSRQLVLKEIGSEGQRKLLKSKVLVVGAGGLGSPALYYLAAAGVGYLGIADFDRVGISNLQRQILHFTKDVGSKKVDSAAEKLQLLNPDCQVIRHGCRITENNIEEILQGYDVVIDAVDNLPTRYLVSDCCHFLNKPLIEGSILGFEGLLMTIIPGVSPCYRCLYPMPPKDGVIPSCSDTGVMGMTTGVIGSLQALEAVKVLLGIGDILSGRLMTFNGLTLEFDNILLNKNENCPLCGKNPSIRELVQYDIQCKLKI